jgi:RNA polymerase sigma-70 factor (ECF subfamily)
VAGTNDTVKPGTSHAESGNLPEPLAPWSESARERLFRLAYRLLWNRADAEDAVQEALLAAYDRSAQLRDAEKWRPWVCRIVVQRCRLLGRRASTRRRHERFLGEISPTRDAAAESGSAELKVLLVELLDELPRRQREVLVLRHLHGMAFDEIAEVLQLSAETARVHAHRGRERLAAIIERRHPQWLD